MVRREPLSSAVPGNLVGVGRAEVATYQVMVIGVAHIESEMDRYVTKAVPTTEKDQDVINLVMMVAKGHRRANTNQMRVSQPGRRRQHSSSPDHLRDGVNTASGDAAIAEDPMSSTLLRDRPRRFP